MKKHLPWFKHYCNANSGNTLTLLWSKGDTEAIALFWVVLELVARYEDREKQPGYAVLNYEILSRETFWKPSKCRRVLARLCTVSGIETAEILPGSRSDLAGFSLVPPGELSENPARNVSFLIPNWLIFQETRGRKKYNKSTKDPGEERGKRKEGRIRRSNTVRKVENPEFPSVAIAPAPGTELISSKIPKPTNGFLKTYCEAFKVRWGSNPVITGKEAGIAKRIVGSIGLEQASILVQAYLQINDPRIVQECHPLNIFELKLNKLRVALDNGVERPETADDWARFWRKVDGPK